MNPLIVKGVVFGLLLACAALWDMKEREIPNPVSYTHSAPMPAQKA